jgi:hypothetical protein
VALMHLAGDGQLIASGVLGDRDLERLSPAAQARFVGEDGAGAALQGQLVDIGVPGAQGPEMNYLSSLNGGAVAMEQGPAGSSTPMNGFLPVRFAMTGNLPVFASRGTLTVEAAGVSLFGQVFERMVSLFLRESGF